MRIQIVSDLHLEFANDLPSLAEHTDVLVCAGDLAPVRKPCHLAAAAARWRAAAHILYVPGNHEYYESAIDHAQARLAHQCATLGITVLDTASIVIDNVRFIGATLWTDFRLDGLALEPGAHRAARAISDFAGAITLDGKPWTTHESAERHMHDRAFIKAQLAEAERDGTPAVVITHHAPTARCIAPRYHGDPTNPAFASNLEPLIARYQPTLWIHGHVHTNVDVMLGETRVIANPAGYRASDNPCYDPAFCIELDNAKRQPARTTDPSGLARTPRQAT